MEPINLQYTTIKTPLPDFIHDELKTYSAQSNVYHPQPEELKTMLAKRHGVPPSMIFLTAGIDEAIQMFLHTYGDRTYAFSPTYIVYKDALAFKKSFTEIPSLTPDATFAPKIREYKDASLIFLANPNNPCGIVPKKDVLSLVAQNPQAIVVIDEAYGAFSSECVDEETSRYPNMAVFRSFSKDYAMAGIRLGYIIASPDIIKHVEPYTTWTNISYLSVGAAMAALRHEEYFQSIRQDINNRRENFITFLKQHAFTVLPSHINAVVIVFESSAVADRFVTTLNQHGIIVSHGNGNSNIGLTQNHVRIAIGTNEQMETVQQVIEGFTLASASS